MAKRIFLIMMLLFLPILCLAWPAKVMSVTDGDTIEVIREGKTIIISLYGIDCPEENQPYGGQAKRIVARMIRGQTIEIEPVATDLPGGALVVVYINGECLNRKLIEKGLAWLDYKNCQQKEICGQWNELQIRAQMGREGLWIRPDAVPPWQWRLQAQ